MTLSPGKECACRADSGPGSVLDHYVTYRISVEGLLLTLELRSMPTPRQAQFWVQHMLASSFVSGDDLAHSTLHEQFPGLST